jgi:hypothetical protein
MDICCTVDAFTASCFAILRTPKCNYQARWKDVVGDDEESQKP